jgi:hypothetical protein
MATPYYSDPSWYANTIDPSQQQQLADTYGITTDQLNQFLAQNNAASPNNTTQRSGGGPQGVQTSPATGNALTSQLQTLANLKSLGLSGSGQSAQQTPQYGVADPNNPMNQISALGAAALNSPMVINPNPTTSNFDLKSGTSKVPPASISSGVPAAPTGPWSTTPGVLTQAAMPQGTPAPATAAPAAQATGAAYSPGTPYAQAPAQAPGTPPAAPGIQQYPSARMPQAAQPQVRGLTAGPEPSGGGAAGGLSAGIGGLSSALSMWQQKNAASNYAAGGVTANEGDPDPDSAYMGAGASGGPSASQKQAGMALINQASQVGNSMKNLSGWQSQPSAIPSPDDFKQNQGPSATFSRPQII